MWRLVHITREKKNSTRPIDNDNFVGILWFTSIHLCGTYGEFLWKPFESISMNQNRKYYFNRHLILSISLSKQHIVPMMCSGGVLIPLIVQTNVWERMLLSYVFHEWVEFYYVSSNRIFCIFVDGIVFQKWKNSFAFILWPLTVKLCRKWEISPIDIYRLCAYFQLTNCVRKGA